MATYITNITFVAAYPKSFSVQTVNRLSNDCVLQVDQHSVHGAGVQFVSYKKVLFDMGPEYWDRVEMASFHSLSNGIMGE